ncbi:MAG: hypothetical protein BHV99_02940 [Clostridium sp. 26_21]|nr:MAG: hypothetical protein BHV99_02940 [Clostridium sp. 26_21]
MKKTLTIALLVVMAIMAFATVVNAATTSTLADELYSKGAKYGMTSADKVKIERYLAENKVTDAQADKILAKADEAIAVMEKAGVTSYNKLTDSQKSEIKSIATEAAKEVDLKLVFKTRSVEIYNADGKLVETISNTNGKLAYTGNTLNIALVASVISIVAVAAVVARKKLVNA